MKKPFFLISLVFVLFLLASCNSSSSEPSKQKSEVDTGGPKFETRTNALDFIFGTDTLSEITISIERTEWNHLLQYYDWNKRNESYVHADFSLTKDNKTWTYADVGFRIRGNTSRARPQEGFGSGNNNYNQAHFKINFEEFIADGEPERRMANVLKTIMLKRFKDDPTYCREVYGYNLFRLNGIWTSPRAGYAHLKINILEEDGTQEKLDFGIYALIEPVTKQFLKERTQKQGGGSFSSNEGNLWKCTWQSNAPTLKNNYSDSDFGCEKVYFENEDFTDENPENHPLTRETYSYDLKTNKKSFSSAKNEFKTFINELNSLSNSDTASIKAWFTKKMDVDLFIKTYAVNVLLGMWDDYWVNSNNFYFYFDDNGLAYFIPYDYDNILGVNCFDTDWAQKNPLEWGNLDGSRPLIEKLLCVPEYYEKYKSYLLLFSDDKSYFSAEQSAERIKKMQALVKDYVKSENLLYTTDTFQEIYDKTEATWGSPYIDYKLLGDTNNYFTVKRQTILSYCAE